MRRTSKSVAALLQQRVPQLRGEPDGTSLLTSVVANSNVSSQSDSTVVTERTYASISVGPDDSSSLVQTDVSDVSDFVAYRRT